MPSGKPISMEMKQQVCRMVEQVYTNRKIAASVGVCEATVSRLRRRMPMEAKNNSIKQEEWEKWDELTRPYWKDLWEKWDQGIRDFNIRVMSCAKERERLRQSQRQKESAEKANQYQELIQQIGGKDD